jgi:hypothetical protein
VRCGGWEDREELYNSKAVAGSSQGTESSLHNSVWYGPCRPAPPDHMHLKLLGLGCEMIQFIVVWKIAAQCPKKVCMPCHTTFSIVLVIFGAYGFAKFINHRNI